MNISAIFGEVVGYSEALYEVGFFRILQSKAICSFYKWKLWGFRFSQSTSLLQWSLIFSILQRRPNSQCTFLRTGWSKLFTNQHQGNRWILLDPDHRHCALLYHFTKKYEVQYFSKTHYGMWWRDLSWPWPLMEDIAIHSIYCITFKSVA